MTTWTRFLSLLLLACGLSSAPLGSMEQMPELGSATVSTPHTAGVRESRIAAQALSGGDRSCAAPRPCDAPATAASWRLLLDAPLALVEPAPPHGGFELVALLGFRATAPPVTT